MVEGPRKTRISRFLNVVHLKNCDNKIIWIWIWIWICQTVTSSMHWGGLQPSMKRSGWESAPPSLRPWFSAGKKVECSLRVGSKLLPKAKEFKFFGVLFKSEGKMKWELDILIGAACAVMRALYRSVLVKRELSRKAKLSIYRSICVPNLTYGHKLWVAPPLRGFPGTSDWEETPGQPRTCWRVYMSHLAWEHLRIPPEELKSIAGEKDVWGALPPPSGPG